MEDFGIGNRLKMLMEQPNERGKKITSYHIEKHVEGLTSTSVENYISGKQQPGPDKIKKLADFFRVSPGWLMFGEEGAPSRDIIRSIRAFINEQKAQIQHIESVLSQLEESAQKENGGG